MKKYKKPSSALKRKRKQFEEYKERQLKLQKAIRNTGKLVALEFIKDSKNEKPSGK